MNTNHIICILLVGVITGCAGPQYNWSHANKSAADLKIDERQCASASLERRESYVIPGSERNAGQQLSQVSESYMIVNLERQVACLEARGWQKGEPE